MEKYIDNGHINLATSLPQYIIVLLFTFLYVLVTIWKHVNLSFYFSLSENVQIVRNVLCVNIWHLIQGEIGNYAIANDSQKFLI